MKSIAQALARGDSERDHALSFAALLPMLMDGADHRIEWRDASTDRARADGLLACLVLSPHSPLLPDDGDRERAALGRRLFDLRQRWLAARLEGSVRAGTYRSHGGLLRIEWMLVDATPWHMLANLGSEPVTTGDVPEGTVVYREGVTDKGAGSIEIAPGGVKVTSVAGHGALDARQRRA